MGDLWQNMDIFQCMQTKALICFYFTLIRSPRPSLSPSPSQTRLWPRKLSSSWKFTASESFQVEFAGNRGKSMMMGSSCKVRSTGHQQKLLFVSKASSLGFLDQTKPNRFSRAGSSDHKLLFQPNVICSHSRGRQPHNSQNLRWQRIASQKYQ